MTTVTFTSSGTFSNPAGVVSLDCQCWGPGATGGSGKTGTGSFSGSGGGGGEFAEETTLAVTSSNNYTYTVGGGGTSTSTSFPGDSVTVTAHAGVSGSSSGNGGSGSTNSIHHNGGNGGSGVFSSNQGGGGGGGGAGTTAVGGNGGGGNAAFGAGGTGGSTGGGNGGDGGHGNVTGIAGSPGSVPGGGGGGGSGRSGGTSGGTGAGGQITLTYTAVQSGTANLTGVGTLTAFGGPLFAATLAGVGTLQANRAGAGNAVLAGVGTLGANAVQGANATLSGAGTMTANGGLPSPAVVNQWANNYGQGTTFGSVTSSLQSCVVPLTPAFSVGGGSGVASPGNWLFAIASWTQDPAIINVHAGVSDDTHQWWRQFPASSPNQNVRTSISYVPNIGTGRTNSIVPQYVYCAPDGAVAAINVLVVEIAGLGPWDTVTGKTSNYTAAGTSVSLSLGAPAQAGFTIGAVGGDNIASGQAFPNAYDPLISGSSPAAWWKLADASGSGTAADSSGNGHSGTATSVTFGNTNEVIPGDTTASFASASSSHILSSYNPALSAVTVEAWVNLNSLTQASAFSRLVSNSFTQSDNKGFELLLNSGGAQFTVGNGTSNAAAGGGTVPATGWTYVAGTWDGTTIRLYVNGVQAATQAFSGSLAAGTATGIGIGYNPSFSGNFVTGLMAQCAVYSSALSPTQILSHYQTASWVPLATQTQSNGVNTAADNILTSAFLPSTLSAVNVNGTSGSSEDLSGYLLQVLVGAPSPIPATQNPNWPFTKFEVAFGAGFNTPNSELTWTDLTGRLWSWDETTGIQFQLGQLQSTNLNIEIDNFDGALTPSASLWSFTAAGTPSAHNFFTVTTAQAASIEVGDGFTDTANAGSFFTVTNVGTPSGGNVNITFTPSAASVMASPDVISQANLTDGTPMRLRMALGTMAGVNINRWYVLQRNAHEWDGEINANWRTWCPVSGTDLWSAMSSVPPTFYRAEIYEDNPYAWWPMDDQPLEGGVLPVTLLNAATGNTKVMNIVASPAGVTTQNAYSSSGTNLTGLVNTFQTAPPPSIATYAVGTNSGWMYGDPPSATSSISSAGNPVEASPGSASWQQAGLLGTTGSNGWFLSANDATFPGLSGGVTVKGWFNCGFYESAVLYESVNGAVQSDAVVLGQPHSVITVCALTTNSAPVAILQLDLSGHLNLITYNGGTGTSHSVYSASDLRCGAWISVDMTLTTSTWNVLVNGGLTANVSGSGAGMTSAWTYLVLNGDMGASGGASPASIQHGGNMSLAHWAVFPYILPTWRLLAHYTAAISGFGLLPAPVVQLQPVVSAVGSTANNAATILSATPDGYIGGGNYGGPSSPAQIPPGHLSPYSFSMLMTANAGSYSSAPSARAVLGGLGEVVTIGSQPNAQGAEMWVTLANPNAPSYTVYTSSSAGAEAAASIILGAGDDYSSGYGASASGHGVSEIGGGSGASPPTAATPLGDTVAQRIERLMRAGRTTCPQRSIDPASDLVQAPGSSGGGQQTGSSIQAIQASDGGFLAVDNVGNLFYWSRDHLASQFSSPVWAIGPDTGQIPYYPEYRLVNDPQRIYNVITVQPFSPSGAQLPLLTPQDATDVLASQNTHGAQPLAITSYLQSQTLMQQQANFLFTNYGQPQTRAENVRIDAAPNPAGWNLVAGINVGDIVTLEEWQVGGGGQQLTLRVTEINRKIRFGGQDEQNSGAGTVVASVELILDAEPSSYWGD